MEIGKFFRQVKDNDSIIDKTRDNSGTEYTQENYDEYELDDMYGSAEYESEHTEKSEYEEDEYSIYDDSYKDEEDIDEDSSGIYDSNNSQDEDIAVDNKKIKSILDGIARSGCNIVVSGVGGSGVSTVSYNLATVISRLGYNTLIVDLDTEQRAQSYISEASYKSVGVDCINLEKVINNELDAGRSCSYIKKNLYMLTLGAATDAFKINDTIDRSKMDRFIGQVKSTFDFVIYDTPIENIVDFDSSIAALADKLLLVVDSSTWGVMKTISYLFNIEDDSVLNIFFRKASLIFNRVNDKNDIVGKKIPIKKIDKELVDTMDNVVSQLTEGSVGYYFSEMSNVCHIPYDSSIPSTWFSNRSYAETSNGMDTMCRVIESIFA